MNADQWNKLHVSERKRHLQNAGHSPNLAHRAFDFIPKNVVDDMTFAQKFLSRANRNSNASPYPLTQAV